jgi:signal transduction histidine kinase
LIIGGLPRNRVPLLAGLLLLTTGLVVVALVQLRRERELVRLRADFISGVSHELRTPVAQIRMFGETLLLDRVRSPEERQRSLAIIVQESQRLTHLIENVLHFSRSDHGVSRVSLHPAQLDVLLHDIVDSFEPLARSKRVLITRHFVEDLVVPVDVEALRQIMLNLLDNALKYGPPGQTITVTSEEKAGAARISIEDQGPGVALDDAARIWEPFYRSGGHAESTGGTGIGLAIVRQLVELHHGQVRVECGSAGGARFIVELPGASRADGVSGCQPAAAAGV